VCRWESTCATAGGCGRGGGHRRGHAGRRRPDQVAGRVDAASGGVAKVVPKRRKMLPPATEPAAMGFGGDDGSYYLQLPSRMLFKVPSASS
jgi:hypothetical protein